MKIVGYTDRLSVAPGDTVQFMVSATVPSYRAEIVRLIHGDTNPAGPGFKQEEIATSVDGEYAGREQPFYSGSYILVPSHPRLRLSRGFRLEAWVYPTTPGERPQGLLSKWDSRRGAGVALVLDEEGAAALWLGDGEGQIHSVSTHTPVRPFTWYLVSATYDASSGAVQVEQTPLQDWPHDSTRARVHEPSPVQVIDTAGPFIIAGCFNSEDADRTIVDHHFNGKIDSPKVFVDDDLLASWDFSTDIQSDFVRDRSPHSIHGRAINMPMRAVTGRNYTGRETNWRLAPDEYGAIFFHDDDLEDAGWAADFAFTIPDNFRSGIYAAHVSAEGSEDYIPFFVRARPGTSSARIAFLVPIYSYLAYGNEHSTWNNPASPVEHNVHDYLQEQDYYASNHRLLSAYDRHADDTGNCYVSRLRPIVNMRPKYHMALIRGPHQLNADLHLIDWLEAQGYEYDVITDEDLHVEGERALRPYATIVSGSHHEYWSAQMLDGLQAYLQHGGRFMYLSGNGLYWPVGIDAARPHVVEVRRGQNGTGTWRSAPGENYFSTTGEQGGLWRDRARWPQLLVGVGMDAQGFDVALPYRREAGSFDPRAAFIFEGVDDDAVIGDAGLVMGGAAGLELDRLDYRLGTPPHALLLASARGFSDSYQHVVEEVESSDSKQGGTVSPFVRADMVYFECPQGGAVFSVGSITWCGCLSHHDYDNPVSRITGNVLRAFSTPDGTPESGQSGPNSVAP